MGRPRNPGNPPCARCGDAETVSKGRENGRPCWRCLACGRSFGQNLGAPLYRLKTGTAAIVRAVKVVLHRGSLRAAEEQTGHNYETIAAWIERLGDHAEAVTELLVRDLALSEVEVDEFWSFVGRKGAPTGGRAGRSSGGRPPARLFARSAPISGQHRRLPWKEDRLVRRRRPGVYRRGC